MDAETMFREYGRMKRKRAYLESEIAGFAGVTEEEVVSSMAFARHEGEHVCGGGTADPTACIGMKAGGRAERMNGDCLRMLWQELYETADEMAFFERAVSLLPDPLPSFAADLAMEGMPWAEIGAKYGLTHSGIAKRRRSAIRQAEEFYRMREEQETEFMLS